MNHHIILGGQRSGKSRFAERLGLVWLDQSAHHSVSVLATALSGDAEMLSRINRHRQDRPDAFDTVEAPYELGACIRQHAQPNRLLIVDCLTLWLTNWLMPVTPSDALQARWQQARSDLLSALHEASGPVVLVTNEIGWGVIPLGDEVRQFVDELGRLNQDVTQQCSQITLMAGGQPWTQEVRKW